MDSSIKGCCFDRMSRLAIIMNGIDAKTYSLQLVQHALKYGINPCARAYGTTPKTLRKWAK